ncbi:MAG: RsmD family RNA methyltransferase [Acidimicrobiales bacterium]
MRVIAGELRGRRLSAPVGPVVRPTSDRVREAVFDILYSLGGVEGLQVLDLFAGSGALGIEALSRGAASVTFVDREASAIDAVRRNLAGVGIPEENGPVTLIRADVDAWVAAAASRYDLALCDPPYDYEAWSTLVARLPADLAVLESGAPIPSAPGWGVVKSRRYGGTIVTVARPEPVTGARPDSDPVRPASPQLVTERGVS